MVNTTRQNTVLAGFTIDSNDISPSSMKCNDTTYAIRRRDGSKNQCFRRSATTHHSPSSVKLRDETTP